MRLAIRRIGPLGFTAMLSASALAAICVAIGLGLARTPFGTLEILVVPVLSLALLFPALGLMRWLPASTSLLTTLACSRRVQAISSIAGLALVLILIWVLYGRILGAEWSAIDDHEIMWFLGPTGKLALQEIPAKLALTEVGKYGLYPRFRPTYYVLRLLEAAAWGRNPALWYGARLAILASAAGLCWVLVRPVLGNLGGALLCAYALSFPFWTDVFGRLGPSEAYAAVGLLVYVLGFVLAWRQPPRRSRAAVASAACILIGMIACVGSKENMLILVVPTAYLGYQAYIRRNFAILAAAAVSLAFSILVGLSIVMATTGSGVDIYGREVAIGARLGGILGALRDNGFRSPLTIMAGGGAALLGVWGIAGQSKATREVTSKSLHWLAVLLLLYLSQWFFYGEGWPGGAAPRYSFPGLLYLPASIVLFYWAARALASQTRSEAPIEPALKLAVLTSLTLTIIYHGSYMPVVRLLEGHIADTREFTASIGRISAALKQDPQVPLIVETGVDVWSDYERAYSYPRFLRAYLVANPLFLRMNGYTSSSFASGIEAQLASGLERSSHMGDEYYSPLWIWEESGERCYSLFLSAEYVPPCTPIR